MFHHRPVSKHVATSSVGDGSDPCGESIPPVNDTEDLKYYDAHTNELCKY